MAAGDVVYAASSLLELRTNSQSEGPTSQEDGKSTPFVGFNEAYDCLGLKSDALLKQGVAAAISLQKVP